MSTFFESRYARPLSSESVCSSLFFYARGATFRRKTSFVLAGSRKVCLSLFRAHVPVRNNLLLFFFTQGVMFIAPMINSQRSLVLHPCSTGHSCVSVCSLFSDLFLFSRDAVFTFEALPFVSYPLPAFFW